MDRVGYKRGLLAGTMLMVVSIIGIALAHDASGLSVLNGIGSSILWVTGAPFMAANSQREDRTHLFSVQFSLNTFSGFFGFLLGGHHLSLSLPVSITPFIQLDTQ